MGATEVAHRVQTVRDLTDNTFVLRFDRAGMQFRPGQHLDVGLKGDSALRKYSIYSTPNDDFLEILVREVKKGRVSPLLRRLSPGDELSVEGPSGFFLIPPEAIAEREFLFVATGTGISPFHCFAGAYPGLRYRLLHGVRFRGEMYEHHAFHPGRVVSCVSREVAGDGLKGAADGDSGDGREAILLGEHVTDYLSRHETPPETLCYLCGNRDMIDDASAILKSQGVPPENLFAEEYF